MNATSNAVDSTSYSSSMKDVIQPLQSKAKDMEQRLAAAIIQQQQMLALLSSAKKEKGNSATKNKNQDSLVQQQQQQQQQISKNINRYRMVLCETYADWILSSPITAVQYDVMNALWRSCFYGRIGPARTRIQKEQKKCDTVLLGITSSTQSNNPTNTAASQTTLQQTQYQAMVKSLQQQKESLHLFLKEGITLYEYLCQKLQQHLVQIVQDQSRPHNDEDEAEETDESHPLFNGIVPCLYRLYIHLGDLYRYGESNQNTVLASAAYGKAMRLGPAYGHAYNQLAVIYQTKDTSSSSSSTKTTNHHQNTTTTISSSSLSNKNQNNTITTVYWYTRSLGAAQEPFITASSNLMRLLESNRQWLQQEQNQQKKILLRPDQSKKKKKKNDDDDDGNVQKLPSAKMASTNQSNSNSRLCLSNFVDVQYTFFTMAKEDTAKNQHHHPHDSDIANLHSLTIQIRTMMSSIQELLNNSSFSDSLLCKVISIMAFIEYHCHYYPPNDKNHTPTPHSSNDTIWKLRFRIRIMMYDLGQYMAARVHTTVMNKIQKHCPTSTSTSNTSTTVPSIRVLLPLLLLTEYLLHTDHMNPSFGQQQRSVKVNNNEGDNHDSSEKETYHDASTLFWKTMIDVYNTILSLDCVIHGHPAPDTNPNQTPSQIQEYQELRGFLPFESFLKSTTKNDEWDPYLTDAGYLSDTCTVQMMDALLDRKGTMPHHHPQPRTTQDSSSHRYTSQGSFSTNISVASSTTNNSASNQNSKEAMWMKLQRFVGLRTKFLTTLPRHVRAHHTTDALVWIDDSSNDMDNEYNYNADTRMQNNINVKDSIQYDDDDGGDCIVAMMDENECTINAIHSLVADENMESNTVAQPQYSHNDKNRKNETLLMYQHDDGGPALLVPGALLFESSEHVATSTARSPDPMILQNHGVPPPTMMMGNAETTTSFNALFDDSVYNMNPVNSGTSLTPPPGFASTVGMSANPNPFSSSNDNNNDSNASVGGETSMYGTGTSMFNRNINSNNWFGTTTTNSATPATTIGESMLLFGGPSALQTANPFAITTDDSRRFFDNPAMKSSSSSRNYMPSFHSNDTDMMFGSTTTPTTDDDTLLFNSGLLKSLLMEETTTGGQQQAQATKNPFA